MKDGMAKKMSSFIDPYFVSVYVIRKPPMELATFQLEDVEGHSSGCGSRLLEK